MQRQTAKSKCWERKGNISTFHISIFAKEEPCIKPFQMSNWNKSSSQARINIKIVIRKIIINNIQKDREEENMRTKLCS